MVPEEARKVTHGQQGGAVTGAKARNSTCRGRQETSHSPSRLAVATQEAGSVSFRPTTRGYWVNLNVAEAEAIADTIRAWPTGALAYEGDGVAPEEPDEPTTVDVRPNGLLYLRGRLRIRGPGGRWTGEEYRVALCRCGASENKPYCDNGHRLTGFRDAKDANLPRC